MHADDLPPALEWERGIWWLYLRVQTQWRVGAGGQRIGLDYAPAIALIKYQGWNLAHALELLQIIERQALTPDGEGGDD